MLCRESPCHIINIIIYSLVCGTDVNLMAGLDALLVLVCHVSVIVSVIHDSNIPLVIYYLNTFPTVPVYITTSTTSMTYQGC
jgi:hypothetical protein